MIFIHLCYFPKKINNAASIPTFPPLIMLFCLNLGFLIGISNLYILQLYELPSFFNIFRSKELGFLIIIISFLLVFLSVGLFRKNNEDPNPTTRSTQLITTEFIDISEIHVFSPDIVSNRCRIITKFYSYKFNVDIDYYITALPCCD